MLVGTGDTDNPDGLFHRQHYAAQWRAMNGSLVFVGPRGIAEEARKRCLHLGGGIFIRATPLLSYAPGKFFFAYRQILRHVIEYLGAAMRCAIRPPARGMGRLYSVTDIFAIALTYLSYDMMLRVVHIAAIAGIWTNLLAFDKHLGRAVN